MICLGIKKNKLFIPLLNKIIASSCHQNCHLNTIIATYNVSPGKIPLSPGINETQSDRNFTIDIQGGHRGQGSARLQI